MICSRRALARFLPALALSLVALTGQPAQAAEPQVKFVTSEGDFVVEVAADKAPKTAANFLQYVRDGFYDGTIFHRVIPNFMIQGGGFDEHYAKKPTRAPIAHEGRVALAHGLKNVVGSIAMARTADPNSATSQFFINVANNAQLDPVPIPDGDPVPEFHYLGQTYKNVPRANLVSNPQLLGYTVFGQVVSGMDTVEKISHLATGAAGPFASDVPKTMVVIRSARIIQP
ncbi:MAG: peptidylprolyl isomerase [Burkholderiaceae bacterium]|nr:MAG: peptidylprolyl isomerase [Burkholderiaceae bacterium]